MIETELLEWQSTPIPHWEVVFNEGWKAAVSPPSIWSSVEGVVDTWLLVSRRRDASVEVMFVACEKR